MEEDLECLDVSENNDTELAAFSLSPSAGTSQSINGNDNDTEIAFGLPISLKAIVHECHICDEIFVFKNQLDDHLQFHDNDDSKPFTCTYCNQKFARLESFNIHKRIHGEFSEDFNDMEETQDADSSEWNTDLVEQPYRCGFCEKTFSLRRQLKCHLATHTKPFVCPICGKAFARQYVLKNHIKSHSASNDKKSEWELNKERPYVCGFCKEKFTSVILLNEHLEQHMAEKSLNDDSLLQTEELNIADPGENFNIADPGENSNIADPGENSNIADPGENSNIADPGENSNIDTSLYETLNFQCELCPDVWPHTHVETNNVSTVMEIEETGSEDTQNFHYEDVGINDAVEQAKMNAVFGVNMNFPANAETVVVDHGDFDIKTEVRYQCQYCEETFPSKWQRSDHKRLHVNEKRFTCHVCGKKFFRRADCNMHYRIHTGERRFSCNVCQKTFLKNWNLKIHMLSHRFPKRERKNKNLVFKCEYCEKSFAWVSGLNRHRKTHTGEKSFECDVCHKLFTRGQQAKMHERSHFSHERPFKCTLCPKDYSRQESLKIHRRMCHPEEEMEDPSNQKPRHYPCDFCPRTFTMKSRLRTHVRIHTGERPFACTMCDKTYLYLYGLTLHMSTHTGHKPYHCELCPMKFAAPGTLKRHIRTHTGETPYSCEKCGKSYGQTNNLRLHEKKCLKS